jgi:hypothetical protein
MLNLIVVLFVILADKRELAHNLLKISICWNWDSYNYIAPFTQSYGFVTSRLFELVILIVSSIRLVV